MKSACGVLLSIVPCFAFIIVFLGIFACLFSPCRVFASNATILPVSPAGEEIATFDEEEKAVFDSEPEAGISPLLHADHYQPAGYFPERLRQSVVSHRWIRILSFAVLVMLALVTSRFFGKRRHDTCLAGGSAVFKKTTAIVIGAFLASLVAAAVSNARGGGHGHTWGVFEGTPIHTSVKDGVASLLGEDQKIYQTNIDITEDVKQILNKKLGWQPEESSIKVYYSKTQAGAVEAYAFVLSAILQKCGGLHNYCIKVSPEGKVEGVQILDLNCPHSFGIDNPQFLDQFTVLNTANASSIRIDAVTRTTLSSDLTLHVVRRALALFDVLKRSSNA